MLETKSKVPTLRLVALAAVAGILVGTTALYVMGAIDGNRSEEQVVAQGEASCPAQAERLAALDPLIRGDVAALLPAKEAQSVGALAFRGPDGSDMKLADLSGKVLLVNLWATWCAPCREEMPALDQLQAEKGSDRFEVVAVNIDRGGDEKPKGFLDEIGVRSLAYYRDETTGIFNELRRRNLALGLPVTLLVDEDGCLLAHMNGPAHWSGDDAEKLIEAALGRPAG